MIQRTHLKVWNERQSLCGEQLVLIGSAVLKAEVKRNAYDFQSWLNVSVLGTDGWAILAHLPLGESQIQHHSYTTRGDAWETAIEHDLDELIEIGAKVLGHEIEWVS